jgi:hypothetical protein
MRGMSGPARSVAAGLAISLVATGTALAAPPPGSSLLDRRIYYAEQAIDNAGQRVERDHACRQRPPEQGPVDGAPSARFKASIAALRRPARPGEDLRLLPHPGFPFDDLSVYRDYVRVLTAPDGASFTVFPLHDISRASRRPTRCVTELRRRVEHAIADRPRAFKRIARRLLRDRIANYWAPQQREGLLLATPSGGATVTLALFRQRGLFLFRWGTGGGTLGGLVPDGVATIDFTFRRFEPTGYWSKHHPVTLRTTGTVANNVVGVTAPNTLRDGVLNDQVWRGADGHVIRVIRG